VSLDNILEALKKYGVKAVLVLWILRSETRLNVVEDKLYNCYATMQIMSATERRTAENKNETYAILPTCINVKRDSKRYFKA
jgi:soluble lytic murein transglycosylase-like protein